jgi:hypothetical protein
VAGGWRRLHNELHNLYTSPNIVKMVKSRRIRLVGHATHTGEMRNAWKNYMQSRRVWNSCEHGNEPLSSIKGGEFD